MRSNLEKNSSYGIAVSDPALALKPSEKPGEHGRHVSIACSRDLDRAIRVVRS